jgi:Mce-associated membrane protein
VNDMLITGPAVAEPTPAEVAPSRPLPPTTDVPTGHDPAGPRRPGMPGWLRAGVVALLVAAVAVGGVLLVQQRDHDARQRAGQQALAAARSAAVAVLSYDHRHLDEDFAAARALTAQPFTAEYERTTSKAVRPVATKNAAVVKASVSAAGVVRAGTDRVVVLAFVNQETTSTRLQRPQLDQNRVELTMVRASDGRWLVAGVKAM